MLGRATAPAGAPLVSVIVPAWNAAPFVRQAVHSILSQTLNELEVIVVDDGSSDGTANEVRSIRDPRVHVLTQANSGPAAARNRGVSAAQSPKYVAFLDADDFWDPDKLERQVAHLDASPACGAVGSFLRYVSSSGRVLGVSGHVIGPAEHAQIARGEFYPFPAMSCLVVRREVLQQAGGFDEPLGRIGSEDLDFMARIARVASIETVPEVLGSYRVHPGSAMAMHGSRVSRAARFVRRRLAERDAGRELTWEAFIASEPVNWTSRRRDAVERCYRGAALRFGERRTMPALAYALGALAIDPWYTLRRVYRQRIAPRPATLARART